MYKSSGAGSHLRIARGFMRFGQVVGGILLLAALFRIPPILSYAFDALRMRTWVATEATLIEAEYHQGADQNKQVRARYRYRVNHIDYEGTRVDIAQGPEIVGEFQKNMAGELARHLQDGTPVVCYVNPERPVESVLYRTFYVTVLTFRLVLFLVLTGGGLLFFVPMTFLLRRGRQLERRRRDHPEEPWLWQSDWTARRIATSRYKRTWIAVLLFFAYVLVVLPLGLLLVREWGRPILSVPGVILILVAWGAFNGMRHALKARRRLGGSEFRMAGACGVQGGPLYGIVVFPSKMAPDTTFRVSLECIEVVPSRGRHDTAKTVVHWRHTAQVRPTPTAAEPNTTVVPVYFAIPYDSYSTDPINLRFQWWLKVAPVGMLDGQYALFVVPVFKTPESSSVYEHDRAATEAIEVSVHPDAAAERAGCRVEPAPEGAVRVCFDFFNWTVLFGAIGLVLATAGLIIAMLVYLRWQFGCAIMPAIFGVMLIVGTIEMLLWSAWLDVRADGVTVVSGYPGFRRRLALRFEQVADIEADKEFALQERDMFCLRLATTAGDRVMLAKRLESRQEADALRAWVLARLPESVAERLRRRPVHDTPRPEADPFAQA